MNLIGFPDFIYNDTALDEYYANVRFLKLYFLFYFIEPL